MPASSIRITIAAVGRLRERAWRDMQAGYLERLQRYAQIDLVEVKDVAGRAVPEQAALQKEGEQLLRITAEARRRILLAPDGRLMTSPELAGYLQRQWETFGHMAFLVGGPTGFSSELRDRTEEMLSLSPLTFPHELARIMLLEQLYRAFTILRGEKYHK
jgi:23S rRNA (pseudouridine1915-N3)-methyltransferase